MGRLRAPDGCPWDREQTHGSLKRYVIEEAYELLDAIDDDDDAQLIDELGDVLLQVVFHSQIATEEGRFDLQRVARRCCEKLVHRHPHVFGDSSLPDAQAVLQQWERLKRAEPAGRVRTSVLDGIPRQLPALSQAEKVQKKAGRIGVDVVSGDICEISDTASVLASADSGSPSCEKSAAIGRLLFSVVGLARKVGVDPEAALREHVERVRDSFRRIEIGLVERGEDIHGIEPRKFAELWQGETEETRAENLPAVGIGS